MSEPLFPSDRNFSTTVVAGATNPQHLTLTDDDIAFLRAVGAFVPTSADAPARQRLRRMVAAGLVEPTCGAASAKYQLTGKAERFLEARDAAGKEA